MDTPQSWFRGIFSDNGKELFILRPPSTPSTGPSACRIAEPLSSVGEILGAAATSDLWAAAINTSSSGGHAIIATYITPFPPCRHYSGTRVAFRGYQP